MSERVARIARTTKETDIDLSVDLDGTGVTDVETVPSGAIQLGITGVDERVPVSRRRVVPLKKALSL